MGIGRYVKQLTRDELNELKQIYISETTHDVSWGKLSDSESIPDSIIFEYFSDVNFVNDDFFCNQKT